MPPDYFMKWLLSRSCWRVWQPVAIGLFALCLLSTNLTSAALISRLSPRFSPIFTVGLAPHPLHSNALSATPSATASAVDNHHHPPTATPITPTPLTALQRFQGMDLIGKDGPLQKLSFALVYLLTEYEAYAHQPLTEPFQTELPLLQIVDSTPEALVLIDATAADTSGTLLDDLKALGLRNGTSFGVVISGQLPIPALEQLAALDTLRFAEAALPATNRGLTTSQADLALQSASARANFAVTGQGINIGVLSDSYNCLDGATADVASDDLPKGVALLAEEAGCATGRDEGRAMIQLMADIAPDARYSFHTAFGGRAAFANGIVKLAETTAANIIVDDVFYYNEPMFQDGIIAQAVNQVADTGVAYFSSAGNAGRQAYQSAFVSSINLPMISAGLLHDFDPGTKVDPLQEVTIPVGTTAAFVLQWDQPFASANGGAGAANDLDLVLVGASLAPIALSIDNNIGRNPVEVLQYKNPGPGTTFFLAIAHVRGPVPQLMKYVYFGTGVTINEYATRSGTIFGHAGAVGAETVGAAFYNHTPAFGTTPPRLEPFSSSGPVSILFDARDQPVMEVRQKPELVAPDGVNTTFFGRDIVDPGNGSDSDTFPNFFGTSAAAPHAAAVAALLLEVDPTLLPPTLYSLLQQSTVSMGRLGYDEDAGYGLLQANLALAHLFRNDLVNLLKSEPIRALPGQPVSYSLSGLNRGPDPAPATTLTVTLPTELHDPLFNSTGAGLMPSSTAPHVYVWQIATLAPNEGYTLTVQGNVSPLLQGDTTLLVSAVSESPGDTVPTNNRSQATINVVVPQIQFASYATAADGSQIVTVTLDLPNPYAAVTAGYQRIGYNTTTNQLIEQFSGTVTIPPGQSSVTVHLPAPDQLADQWSLHLITPSGAQLGALTMLVFTVPPHQNGDTNALDDDGDGIPTEEEDGNGDGNPANDDTDGDGTPDYLDTDDDGDTVLTRDEDRNGNGNPLDDDTDNDTVPNYLDPNDDNDRILTRNEDANGNGDPRDDDSDSDGIADYLDPDSPATARALDKELYLPLIMR